MAPGFPVFLAKAVYIMHTEQPFMDIIYKMQMELRRRKYSSKTQKAYLFYFRRFLVWSQKELRRITRYDVEAYLDYLALKGHSGSTLNLNLQAIKFGLGLINKRIVLNMKHARLPKRLPTVLTKEEVRRLLNAICNRKQWLLVALMYSAGLRVGEVVCLRRRDLELDEGIGWVRAGKGNKDRMFIIAKILRQRLEYLISGMKPWEYVFKGRMGHYSVASVQQVVRRAARDAELFKNVHPHTLRHSFATHLLEQGEDLVTVQSLLGHKESRTTFGYLHMVRPKLNCQSPFDTFVAKA